MIIKGYKSTDRASSIAKQAAMAVPPQVVANGYKSYVKEKEAVRAISATVGGGLWKERESVKASYVLLMGQAYDTKGENWVPGQA